MTFGCCTSSLSGWPAWHGDCQGNDEGGPLIRLHSAAQVSVRKIGERLPRHTQAYQRPCITQDYVRDRLPKQTAVQ
jgi:hypothetical protein